MSDTEWFERKLGDHPNVLSKELPEGGHMMVLTDKPDWVRVPEGVPGLQPGSQAKVLDKLYRMCPHYCGVTHRALDLEGGYTVIECPRHGFSWCSVRKATDELQDNDT
jgi:hypothetical protein